jgi:hypothetical protein
MISKPQLPVPVIVALRKMGQDISDARRRRRPPAPAADGGQKRLSSQPVCG